MVKRLNNSNDPDLNKDKDDDETKNTSGKDKSSKSTSKSDKDDGEADVEVDVDVSNMDKGDGDSKKSDTDNSDDDKDSKKDKQESASSKAKKRVTSTESYREDEQPETKDMGHQHQGAENQDNKDTVKPSGTKDSKTKEKVSEHFDAIFKSASNDLSEDFKNNAKTVFESAVHSLVEDRVQEIEEQAQETINERMEEYQNTLQEQVDGYLNHVVEKFFEENSVAIEKGIKQEIVEDFLSDLKTVFENHYIDVPESKFDMYESTVSELEEMKSEMDSLTQNNMKLQEQLFEMNKSNAVSELSENLTETQAEKFRKLTESIDANNIDEFKEKASVLKGSYFTESGDSKSDKQLNEDSSAVNEENDEVKMRIRKLADSAFS